jgi:hypothetical protein
LEGFDHVLGRSLQRASWHHVRSIVDCFMLAIQTRATQAGLLGHIGDYSTYQ